MKINELYFTKDEAKMIELNDSGKYPLGGPKFIGETLDDFLEDMEVNEGHGYDFNAQEINYCLKLCGIKKLSINTGFKSVAGMMFTVDGQYFCRKGYGYGNNDGYIYKSAKWHNKRPIYLPEHSDGMDEAYTGQDFINICRGDVKLAKELFSSVDWQHPETLYEEWVNHGEIKQS